MNQKMIEAAAAAIANARGGRRGAPVVANILDVLPEKLRAEVMEDATAALKAAEPTPENVIAALNKIARYDDEPIWSDDRDDAANEMLMIARQALGEEE